ncbi:MAG: site-specific DNA-methyltransferase [Sedimentisphaeraceae bacterium JB056]
MEDTRTFNKLISKLKELFMLDRQDLDFGIYRIMNSRRSQITQFLEKDLLPQVRQILNDHNTSAVNDQLQKAIANARELGIDPDTNAKVMELRAKKADLEGLENEVYSHLYSFFSRYYKDGDFISLRRYKEGVYAIPYEGEEVKLYWANQDQYYIKTSEYFKNYRFNLSCGKSVHFKVKEAGVEKDNIKEASGKERRFSLSESPFFSIEGDELVIGFNYLPLGNSVNQAELNRETLEHILAAGLPGDIQNSLQIPMPTGANKNRTLLEKHINDFTSRNTFDYFIHKDLGGFLRRELDFYIKNEVVHLDDIEDEDAAKVESYLSKVKAMRKVASKIITFLAQLEDFQKKLWLKKKFVTETNYCITLDRVPTELYPEIAANDAQRNEWVELFAIDQIKPGKGDLVEEAAAGYSEPLSIDFLKQNDKLVVDTKFFHEAFKEKLLASIDNIDEQCDGLLINSENFQALNLLQVRYREQVKCVYIDPPYNTGNDDNFPYKDSYQHSSWLSMMFDRAKLLMRIMDSKAPLFCSIDQDEWHELRLLFELIFGNNNYVNEIVWQKLTAAKKQSTYFSNIYEKVMVFRKSSEMILNKIFIDSKKDDSNYPYIEEETGRKYGSFDFTQKGQGEARLFNGNLIEPPPGKHWIWGQDKINEGIKDNRIIFTRNGTPRVKRYLDEKEGNPVGDFWIDDKIKPLSANDSERIGFETQKPLCLIDRILKSSLSTKLILDCFAGSGTTGHAVINLNRQDDGSRKYILVEMGDYFDTVLKPRIQKVIYSKDWKAGNPAARDTGVSHCFKYIRLESYEDTLNNLVLEEGQKRRSLFAQNDELRESYMLGYMLDVESRGSLLNVTDFENPFDYKLNITTGSVGETKPVRIDIIETFSYLIGLKVATMETIQGFKVITGTNLDGEKILVIWRNIKEKDNDTLDDFCRKMRYNPLDMEFDTIYVNGDNNLENLKRDEDTWKVRLIEEEFAKRMFDS